MNDGGGPTSVEVEVWKSSQKCSVQRSAVRSSAWLGESIMEDRPMLPRRLPPEMSDSIAESVSTRRFPANEASVGDRLE
jgi:hypothetical protein